MNAEISGAQLRELLDSVNAFKKYYEEATDRDDFDSADWAVTNFLIDYQLWKEQNGLS